MVLTIHLYDMGKTIKKNYDETWHFHIIEKLSSATKKNQTNKQTNKQINDEILQ